MPGLARWIILDMGSANERPLYIVISSVIGWAHTQFNPWCLISYEYWDIGGGGGGWWSMSFQIAGNSLFFQQLIRISFTVLCEPIGGYGFPAQMTSYFAFDMISPTPHILSLCGKGTPIMFLLSGLCRSFDTYQPKTLWEDVKSAMNFCS